MSNRPRKSAQSGALSVSKRMPDQRKLEQVVAGLGTRQAGAACSAPHAKEIKMAMRTFRSVNSYDDSDMKHSCAYNTVARTECVISSSFLATPRVGRV
jgi:hypothetical protein